jgi:3-phenylpropionate/trans-cinnamate dioxygenase ferredoxin reductase subunit
MGKEVTVLEAQERLMPRVVSAPISEFYLHLHRRHGVQIFLDSRLDSLSGEQGHVASVHLANGVALPASLVIAAIGVVPNDELARASGIACDNGILVDEFACTSDPDIVAAGDCANHHNAFMGGRLRLESVQNAGDQARTAASTLLGQKKPYAAVPWFWSDQYDMKLQIAGLAGAGDRLVQRGDPSTRKFAVFHLRDGAVAAVEAVNAAPEYLIGRKLIAERTPVSAERLADRTIPVKNIA